MGRLDFIATDGNLITSNDLQFRVVGNVPVDVNSISITLYQNHSDKTVVNKDIQSPTTMTGTLREGTSVLNPIITINSGTMFWWNYCYIPDLGRYYYITDVQVINTNLYRCTLKCDVLMSFKNGITSLKTRVLRSQDHANWQVNDSLLPANAWNSKKIYNGLISSGLYQFPYNNVVLEDNIVPYGHLLLKVACNALIHGATFSYPAFGYVYVTCTVKALKTFLVRIANAGYFSGDLKISDIILEAKWLPCRCPTMVGEYRFVQEISFKQLDSFQWVYIGDLDRFEIRVSQDIITTQETVDFIISGIEQETVVYRNFKPYRSMTLLFPPFGQFELDSNSWGNYTSIRLRLKIDSMSGDALLYIIDSGGYEEQLGTGNVAIPIDLVHFSENGKQIAGAVTSGISSIVMAGMSGSILAVLGAGAQAGFNTCVPPLVHKVSGTGSANANTGLPKLIVKQFSQENPNLSTEGWYYGKVGTLSSFHGFTKVAQGVHVEGGYFRYATKPELDEIETLLTSGVILP